MLKSYFKVALRALAKQKGYAAINIFGLSVGLASAILIFLYIHSELSYDSQFPNADNTYRLGVQFIDGEGNIDNGIWVPGGWSSYLRDQMSEVVNASKYWWFGNPASLRRPESDRILLTEEMYWVDKDMHEVMYFPLIKGNKEKALEAPGSMTLSETAARELFGDEDPMDQQITLKHPWATDNQELALTITGVYEDYPENTHFKPKYLVNYHSLKPYFNFGDQSFEEGTESLNNGFFWSYIVAKPETDQKVLEDRLASLIEEQIRNNPSEVEENSEVNPIVVKVTDMHFDEEIPWQNEGGGSMVYIYTFASIAFLIIAIACINYMNLATARSAKRSKEVGLRKSLGSERPQLILQFMLESFVMVLLAFLVGIALVALFLPLFNELAAKRIAFTELFDGTLLMIILGLLVFVSFISGSYPALFLSGFNPVRVLKGKFAFSKGSNILRKVLISVQFGIAIILLISTIIVIRQMEMIQKSKLNKAGDQIVSIRHGGTAPFDRYQTFKNFVLQDPDIEMVTFGNHLPRLDYFGPLDVPFRFPDIDEEEHEWHTFHVDYDFVKTFDLEVIAGRGFEHGNTADSTALVINETACKALGKTPQEMVDQAISTPTMNGYFNYDYDRIRTGKVIGVVKDFPYQSAYHKIEPLALSASPHFIDRILYVKIPDGKFQEKLAHLETVWKQVYPGIGFDYWFVNDEFNRMYTSERRIASLSRNFSGLAIFITCIGLFGLASFIAEQKTKEIGIRKALGASSAQILGLLLLLFLRVLIFASLVAVPLSYYLSDRWLDNFAYQTPMSWFIFILGVGVIMFLTVLTVSYESLKASLANPVKSLRYE
ncbi:MAG: FtsX-like permease family protein [Bacteroidota bacterium]